MKNTKGGLSIMREIRKVETHIAPEGRAAYILTAGTSPNERHCDIYSYLCEIASSPIRRSIQAQFISAEGAFDGFYGNYLKHNADRSNQVYKTCQKLFLGYGVKDWPLVAVEVLPGEWRLYLVNRSMYNYHHTAVERCRYGNSAYKDKTDVEIAKLENIALFYRTLICRATNSELSENGTVSVNFDVPRYRGHGADAYTLGFDAGYTTICEPTACGLRYIKIHNDADLKKYSAEVIEIQ